MPPFDHVDNNNLRKCSIYCSHLSFHLEHDIFPSTIFLGGETKTLNYPYFAVTYNPPRNEKLCD